MAEEKSVSQLAAMIAEKDPETIRTGKRQLWDKVRKTGRPGNEKEQQALVDELLKLLASKPATAVTRELIWMLSELGGDNSVAPVAALLADPELLQDAAMVLERLPGDKSVAALQAGLKTVPADSKIIVAHALRARGVAVTDAPPCQKLKPCRQTKVTPVGR
jgi:hypothetical protein